MPEGPEIRIAADRIERALAGRTARLVRFAFPQLQPFESALEEEEVVRVETRGKAMLTLFANGLAVYSHNQLYGRWHVGATGERPATRRTLRLAIENDEELMLQLKRDDRKARKAAAKADARAKRELKAAMRR